MPAFRLPIIGQTVGRGALEGVLDKAFAEAHAGLEIERWERRPHQLAETLDEVRRDDSFAGALVAYFSRTATC